MRAGADEAIDGGDLRQRAPPAGPGARLSSETPNNASRTLRTTFRQSRAPRAARFLRFLYAIVVVLLLFLAYRIFISPKEDVSKIVHANRYSKDFKYRPAASPVITETLKDGRTRLRGAHFTMSTTPTPSRKTKAAKPTRKSTGKRKKKGRV